VDPHRVVTGANFGGDTVIEKGLDAGERVVTDGQLMLVPGARVTIKSDASPPAGQSGNGASAGNP
jgi:membrane fusion protein, multidrug efflux system